MFSGPHGMALTPSFSICFRSAFQWDISASNLDESAVTDRDLGHIRGGFNAETGNTLGDEVAQ